MTEHSTTIPTRRTRQFLRAMAWITMAGVLFTAGQLVRWHAGANQSSKLSSEIKRLYISTLGKDYGESPYGRLQFELGKLRAARKTGLDPLAVLAALSRPADIGVRVDSMNFEGEGGTIKGHYLPDPEGLNSYIKALSTNDTFQFTLNTREEVFGGIAFTLQVIRR